MWGWGLVANGTTFANAVKPRQVLFGKRHSYQDKVAVTDFSEAYPWDIYVFESKDLQVLLPFSCQMGGFFNHVVDTSVGALLLRTN